MAKIKNSFELLRIALKDKRLKHQDLKVLLALFLFSGFEKIFPSLNTIGTDAGIKSKSNVSRALNRLEKFSYIEIIRQGPKSNIYKLNYNPEMQTEEKKIKNYITTKDGKKIIESELKKISEEKIYALLKDESEKYLSEIGIAKNFFTQLMKTNKYVSNYKKLLLLMFCIGEVEKRKKEIKNVKAYLTTTFKNLSYIDYHKSVFETRSNRIEIKTDKRIIKEPSINY